MAKTNRLGPLAAVVGLLAAMGLLIALLMLVVEVKPAEAAFPGKNGKIAYTNDDSGAPFGSIYTINPGGGGKTKVTAGYNPSFSPDGKKIAYTVYFGPDSEIYMIDVGGGGKTRITHNNKDDNFPSFSPDGKRIAYSRTTYRANAWPKHEIYTVNVGGGGKTKVTAGEGPSYSPDGKKIAYKRATYSANAIRGDIYTIKVGGGGKFRVTHDKAFEGDPSWGSRP